MEVPNFFMYTEPELDHSWLERCNGFDALLHSTVAEKLAEVGMHRLLANHPKRVRDPAAARLFYVPIYEYSSWHLGEAEGCSASDTGPRGSVAEKLRTHRQRMRAANETLSESKAWQRCQGCDHFFISSGTSSPSANIQHRSRAMWSKMSCAIAGRYKQGAHGGACRVEVPYLANQHHRTAPHTNAYRHTRLGRSDHLRLDIVRRPSKRTTLLYFSGSFDVCCSGNATRCAVARLSGHASPDVILQPTLRGAGLGPCTQLALNLSNGTHRARLRVADPLAAMVYPFLMHNDTAADAHHQEQMELNRLTAEEMTRAKFCLVPAGDTFVSSRLYSVVASGCVPVVVSNGFAGAFFRRVNYSSFVVRVEQREFEAEPLRLVQRLRAMSPHELAQRQASLARFARDVLYDEPGSKVADHFLEEAAARCLNTQDAWRCQPRNGTAMRGTVTGNTSSSASRAAAASSIASIRNGTSSSSARVAV